MRQFVLVVSILAVAGVAHAGDKSPPAERVVYVCDASQVTTRSFEREYGEQRFVTAQEALKAAEKKEAWSAPRCMTRAEYARLERALADMTRPIMVTSREQ